MMMSLERILLVFIYILLIVLLILLIMLAYKLIKTTEKITNVVDDINGKVKTLDGVFSIVDRFDSSLSIIGDRIIESILNLFSKIFNKKKDEEEK